VPCILLLNAIERQLVTEYKIIFKERLDAVTLHFILASAVKRLNATAVPSLHLILEPLPKSGLTKAANTARATNSSGVVASSTSTAQAYYVCSAMNCRQYREAQLWPEPLSFHEFPADPARKKLWIEVDNKMFILSPNSKHSSILS
jgi:hypothetical protein